MNKVTLVGELSEFQKITKSANNEYIEAKLTCKRLSETADVIPVRMREYKMEQCKDWKQVKITGEFQSENAIVDGKNRLLLFVYVISVEEAGEDEKHVNKIELEGRICKEPFMRRTPKGRILADVMVAVNSVYTDKRFGKRKEKSFYIPCIVWGSNAYYAANECKVPDDVIIEGRIQSRVYTKWLGEEKIERTAYELSVSSFLKAEVAEELREREAINVELEEETKVEEAAVTEK